MTVGKVIALLTTYASDEYDYLMGTSIYGIDVNDDHITVYTVDGNTRDFDIYV